MEKEMTEKIENLKLLVELMHKEGITALKIDGIELHIPTATKAPAMTTQQAPQNEEEQFEEDEEVLFWSVDD